MHERAQLQGRLQRRLHPRDALHVLDSSCPLSKTSSKASPCPRHPSCHHTQEKLGSTASLVASKPSHVPHYPSCSRKDCRLSISFGVSLSRHYYSLQHACKVSSLILTLASLTFHTSFTS
ncbi:uncharacterized protein DS421_17g589340 [Arachis hypogaea]|nr:uncharacterized protein DS421_17g589340 [Arachis hypogaea]